MTTTISDIRRSYRSASNGNRLRSKWAPRFGLFSALVLAAGCLASPGDVADSTGEDSTGEESVGEESVGEVSQAASVNPIEPAMREAFATARALTPAGGARLSDCISQCIDAFLGRDNPDPNPEAAASCIRSCINATNF